MQKKAVKEEQKKKKDMRRIENKNKMADVNPTILKILNVNRLTILVKGRGCQIR